MTAIFDSFIRGISRIVDFDGSLDKEYHKSITERSDEDAIREDWEKVGQDMWAAIRRFRDEMDEVEEDA